MSEDIKNEDVVPASVVDNEPIISPEVAEKAAEVVEKLVEESKPVEAEETKSDNVISGPSYSAPAEEKPVLGSVANGVIGTSSAKPAAKPAKQKSEPKKDNVIAVYSPKNIHWDGVGKLSKGFNVVNKDVAEKWLTREGVRIADPKEVAQGYGL
jgi:hypothetical protein